MRKLIFVVAFCCLFGSSAVSAQESLLPTLQAIRSELPTPMTPAQIGELLTRTAQSQAGWVLLRKNAPHNRCPTPFGAEVSCDYLVFAPTGQGFDVLRDQEGLGVPVWDEGDSFHPSQYVAVPVVGGPPPVVTIPPGADDPSHDLILDALAQLETRQSELQALIEREAATLRAEHAAADAHHQTDDEAPGKTSKLDLILGIIGGIAAGFAGWGAVQ